MISIIMPTCNRRTFIPLAIEAIRMQDYKDWELLIVDGGESVRSVIPKDERIFYEYMPGRVDRFNWGIAHAHGDIFMLQADDDEMLPGALSEIESAMAFNEWGYGSVLVNQNPYGVPSVLGVLKWDYARLKRENFIPLPGAFWSREAYRWAGGFDMSVPRASDWDYWIRLGARWNPVHVQRPLVAYNVHQAQDSVVNHRSVLADAAKVRARVSAGFYDKLAA